MQGISYKYDEVSRDAKMLKEKLERYRKARALKLNTKQKCKHESSDVTRDTRVLTEKQAPKVEAGTLVEKLERYRETRARRQKQDHLNQSERIYRTARVL